MRGLSKAAIMAICATLLSGCSIDNIRPDLNLAGGLRIVPSYALNGEEGDTSGEDTSSGGDDSLLPPGTVVVPEEDKLEPVATAFVNANDYTAYLRTVYNEIITLIAKLPSEAQNNIYFKMYHSGYSVDFAGNMSKNSPYTQSMIGPSVKDVRGTVLQQAAVESLFPYNDNAKLIGQQAQTMISNVDKLIEEYGGDETYTSLGYADLGEDVIAKVMAAHPTLTLNQLKQTYSDLSAFNEETTSITSSQFDKLVNYLPQSYIRIAKNGVNTSAIALGVTSYKGAYTPRVSQSAIGAFFTNYNQCPNNSSEYAISKKYSDDYSMAMVHQDGYNRTVVYLGVGQDKTLKDVLGSQYASIKSKIDAIKYVTDTQGYSFEVGVVSAGTQGVS